MRTLFAVAAIALAACSSSAPATVEKKAAIPEPDFEIHQLAGPAEQNYPEGDFEVKFRLDIGNRADVPITLSRVELVTVNPPGGAYSLDRRAYYFHKAIDSHQIAPIEFWAKANSVGQSRRINEPVTIRGILYFDSPSGSFRHVFVKELSQYGAD
jgi:hypothetical protein